MARPLSDWYPWMAGMSSFEAASAFVAAGVLDPLEGDRNDTLWALMRALRDPDPPLLAHLPADSWEHAIAPDTMADLVREALNRIPAPARVRQRSGRTLALPARRSPWLEGELLEAFREAARREGLASDLVFHSPARGPADWAWPVRVGVLPDTGDLGGMGSMVRHWWNGKLFRLAGAGYGAPRFDLLLLHGADAVEALRDAEVEATAVVWMDAPTRPGRERLRGLDELRKLARAVLAADVDPGAQRADWLYRLVAELAHGFPLHVALRMTSGENTRVLADRTALGALDLHATTASQLDRFERTVGDDGPPVRLTRRVASDLDLDRETTPLGLGRKLRANLERLSYDQESGGATTLGGAFAAMANVERRIASADAARATRAWRQGNLVDRATAERLRQLRARVTDADGATTEGLAPERAYTLEVSVGPPTPAWLTDEAPFLEPDGPPQTASGWKLRVVVREPHHLPQPVEASIVLPPAGASTVARFAFRARGAPPRFGARVTLLQGSRVLQTGVLTIDERGARFRTDAAPEPVLAGPDAGWASASLVLNNDATDTPTITAVHERRIGVADLSPDFFDDFTASVSKGLAQIAAQPDLYQGLGAVGSRELLVRLAQGGGKMLRALVRGAGLDATRLDGASRIQIVSTKAATFFPAEFLYGLPIPKDGATLCPGAAQALGGDVACAGPHTRDTVCPTGFWSLSKVIERHAHLPAHLGAAGPFTLYDGGHLPDVQLDPYRQVLYGAASVADTVDPNATRAVEAAARRVARGVARVADWDEWEVAVGRDKPSLLLLLPHHKADRLWIGADSQLSVVDTACVRAADAPDAPLVLLIGCETLLTHAKFNDFVQSFLWCGAKAVVATYGTILGRHASPATVRLLEEVGNGLDQGSVRLGTVLRSLKRRLLLEGQPMVLGLTSHGDADLLLER